MRGELVQPAMVEGKTGDSACPKAWAPLPARDAKEASTAAAMLLRTS